MFPKVDKMSWIGALKFWNNEKGPIVTDTANVWMMPRKGTQEYDEVRAVQQGKEIPSKKEEREARNKATMDKALAQLRQEEAKTKERNTERKQEERQPRLTGRKVGGRHMTDIPGLTLSDDDVTKLFADLQKDVDEVMANPSKKASMKQEISLLKMTNDELRNMAKDIAKRKNKRLVNANKATKPQLIKYIEENR